jgi:hypothetical protein
LTPRGIDLAEESSAKDAEVGDREDFSPDFACEPRKHFDSGKSGNNKCRACLAQDPMDHGPTCLDMVILDEGTGVEEISGASETVSSLFLGDGLGH